ncbi:MAG TPA: IS91 family transposase [Ruminococcaceae bacterium]|nr:IS91 family transposase [Oscillospiraceae bacterium]
MPELQDVFQLYGEEYRRKHKLSCAQAKAMTAIEQCRTSKLGYHADTCENCGNIQISYNSCRNRHCPKCQTLSKERWLDKQKHDLFNTGYFHVVFTVPEALRPLFYQNQSAMYGLLFKTVAETLHVLSQNKKYLGAKLGFTSILHTWGQNLHYHPHIHCIVPGGGLNSLGQWVSSRKKFFLPVRVLSRLFRGKFLAALSRMNLNFFGEQKHLENPADFKSLMDSCYRKEWIVYCKPPFRSAACVVEYLGRYTHRVAISNNRILSIKDGIVSFKWRDYKDSNRWKVMTLSADEFIRRFLMHILPPGFMKIRHYGILASKDKSKRVALCKRLTGTPVTTKATLSSAELIRKITGRDITLCPACGHPWSCSGGLSPPIPA